jgi:plastocyanin
MRVLLPDRSAESRRRMQMSPTLDRIISRRTLLTGGTAIAALTSLQVLSMRNRSTDHTAVAISQSSPVASPQASPEPATEASIAFAMDLTFDPLVLTIAPGTTVTWVNESPMPHTATGDPEQNPVAETNPEYVILPEGADPWGSEVLMPGDSFSHTFTVAGTYEYICIPHVLAGMRGTIMVE